MIDLIDIVARQLLANAAREIEWEDIPDVGEYGWLKIEERLLELAPEPEGFDRAITLLEDMAAKWEENNDERSG